VTTPGRHRVLRRQGKIALFVAVALLALGVVLGIKYTQQSGAASAAPGSAKPVSATSSVSIAPPTSTNPYALPSLAVPGVAGTATASAAPVASAPVELTIAAIGVKTSLQSLGLLADGTLQSPSQWGVAGWYAGGVVPGQLGPAVIAGHIDSTSGPAVFFRLGQLKAGDQATITDQNGAVLTFVVDGSATYPKNAFPGTEVYGATPYPELRLITCTGEFDRAHHNYLSNLVVSAHLVSQGAS
jgi:Sortase domain